jgi:hypothetical protein
VDARENRITIGRENGAQQTYDPRRLSGVAVYEEVQREFSLGDRVQFTAPSRELQVANRELGTIERVSRSGYLEIRMDSGREVRFNIHEHPHLDHGYAVTSHSSQGQTADRVLIHVDTDKSELLVNDRFAYVSVSRGRYDAQIYTNDSSELAAYVPGHISRKFSEALLVESLPGIGGGLRKRGNGNAAVLVVVDCILRTRHDFFPLMCLWLCVDGLGAHVGPENQTMRHWGGADASRLAS